MGSVARRGLVLGSTTRPRRLWRLTRLKETRKSCGVSTVGTSRVRKFGPPNLVPVPRSQPNFWCHHRQACWPSIPATCLVRSPQFLLQLDGCSVIYCSYQRGCLRQLHGIRWCSISNPKPLCEVQAAVHELTDSHCS